MKYTNHMEELVLETLKKNGVEPKYPISVNMDNDDPMCSISCNYMGTRTYIPKDQINEQEFEALQDKQIFLHKTWNAHF